MAPDLPLFVNVGVQVLDYGLLHDVRALAVSTALALALFLVWRIVLRPATRALLPRVIAQRLPSSWDGSAAATLRETFVGSRGALVTTALLVASLALGVLTHIVWDAFTHEGRTGVNLLPILDEMWGPLLGYKWIQYGSGVGGMIVLAVWGALALRRASITALPRRRPVLGWIWMASLPVLLIGAWVAGYLTWGPFTAEYTLQHLAYDTLPQACGAWGVLTLVCAAIVAFSGPRTPARL